MSYMKRYLEKAVATSQYIDLIRDGMDPASIVHYADGFLDGGWDEFFKRQDEANRHFILRTFPHINWEPTEEFPYEITVTKDNVEVRYLGYI